MNDLLVGTMGRLCSKLLFGGRSVKIVHVQQYFNEGFGYQENLLPYYQRKLGHDVVLITSTRANGFGGEKREREESEFEENGFRVIRIPIRAEFNNRFVVFDDLYHHLEREQPDYIFHHSVTAPSLFTVCKYKMNNPGTFLAVDNHADLNISGRNRLWKLVYYNTLWKKLISLCDSYIDVYFGVTPARCMFLEEELGVSAEKIRLLPIGADTDHTQVNISKLELFAKYGIDENCLVIVHGGKMTPEKQVVRIVEAFKRIDNDNIRLVLFGSISDPMVEQAIRTDKRIRFIGWLNREETLAVLKYSDIGIWNKQHTTLLEDCIAVGLPLILRYYGSTCHLIDGSGIYLYEGSVREIYDALKRVAENSELIQTFKKNAISLSRVLSYDNIVYESIMYQQSLEPLEIHRKFMSRDYCDKNFPKFRKVI